MTLVTCRDELTTGGSSREFTLPAPSPTMTVRELIRLRVREEVAAYNAAPSGRFVGLVRPAESGVERDGYRLRRPRRLEWQAQADAAERAFARNGFVVLVGDRQVDTLDEVVDLSQDPELVFIRLVPLVGG